MHLGQNILVASQQYIVVGNAVRFLLLPHMLCRLDLCIIVKCLLRSIWPVSKILRSGLFKPIAAYVLQTMQIVLFYVLTSVFY